jgi:hypothetical protein
MKLWLALVVLLRQPLLSIGTISCVGTVTVGFTLAVAVRAEPPTLPAADPTAFDQLLIDTLRDVHNLGADLYNTTKDYTGTYRLYHGALLTVRPLLSHRPTVQQRIAEGLQEAERQPTTAHKAFHLHVVIEQVRSELKKAIAAQSLPKTSIPGKPTPPSEPKPAAPAPGAPDPQNLKKLNKSASPAIADLPIAPPPRPASR